MDIFELAKARKMFGGKGGGNTGGDTPSSDIGVEWEVIGAEVYLVMEGMCLPLPEFMCMSIGDQALARAYAAANSRTVMRDEPPHIGLSAQAQKELGAVLFVRTADGLVGMYAGDDSWSNFDGMPQHGWIDKDALDALDYSDPSNIGLYAVRTVRRPFIDGTLVDFVCNLDIIYGSFGGFQLLNTITLPNATSIGMYAFAHCYSLTNVNIPRVVAIGEHAFYGCKILKSITLPDSLLIIGEFAFWDNKRLETVTLEARNPPTLLNNCFGNCESLTKIIVPKGCADAYTNSEYWSQYADIIDEAE